MITNQELTNQRKQKSQIQKQIQIIQNELFDISPEDWKQLQALSEQKSNKLKNKLTKRHNKKLNNLGINTINNIQDKNINKSRNKIDKVEAYNNAQIIYNISNKQLSDIETRVLQKGLKYGIKNKKVDEYEILSRFEQLAQSLNRLPIAAQTEHKKTALDPKNNFLQRLQTMAFEFIELSKQSMDNLSDEEHRALESLSKDKSIIITKADKGNAVVIQNVDDYILKCKQLISDSSKFRKLYQDPTIKRETSLQNKLRQLKKKERISNELYKAIYPNGSKAGVLYGLPKIHKNGTPIRPIISQIGAYNYKTAKFLVKILTPLLDNSNVTLSDTFDFVNKISKTTISEDCIMISFDVESLFTNVPVKETIDIILARAFKDCDEYHGLKEKDLRELLQICVQESHFQFDNEFYDQIDGVSMGSPLGPLFANIFMDELENKNMNKLKELGVKVWYRYVDDIFI